MIVVDTSALMAILQDEAMASACKIALGSGTTVLMSAGTLAEALIVAARKGGRVQMQALIVAAGIEIVPVTAASAQRAADAYDRWGKGVHPASLNLGDCFAYALAKELACPLLYVGKDFSRTDIASVLA